MIFKDYCPSFTNLDNLKIEIVISDKPIKEIIKHVSQDKEMPHLIIEAHKTRHKYSDNDLKNNIIKLKNIVKDI